jgi:hypothetical protein
LSGIRWFEKDIHREINGVIKVGQLSEEDVRQELEEYVITRELRPYLEQFFERYASAMASPTDKVGVWISGFFGSGKSHFLKILAYLLENRSVAGQRALEIFAAKLDDPLVLANLTKAATASKDVILFNIDSRADATSKSDKEAVVKVFMKVFDEHVGYFGTAPEIAAFERGLDRQGKYAAFKQAYAAATGKAWIEDRENWGFRQDEIVAALQQTMGMSEAAALAAYTNAEATTIGSVEGFAKLVKEYLTRQPAGHQVVFMVDEVGQYVGENTDLMLNLQTIVEDLGVHCAGRAWVVVTSQEDIDAITQHRVKGNDFSKIQGRFRTRLSLSSANTDEVIKLRLLRKTTEATTKLTRLYGDAEQVIKNQIRFTTDTADMPGFANAESFVASYPFVPYQFGLLQKVFTQIRLHGASGKHLARGERSMLDAFQIAAKRLDGQATGVLAPFHSFYAAVEGFLDARIKSVIAQAHENSRLQPEDVALLQTLFMIKYVKEIKGAPENLTTLSLERIDQERLALRQQIDGSLARLERETLIQRNGDVYEFLTNEEQDVGREIKNFTINPGETTTELQKRMWEELFTVRRYQHDARHQYAFQRRLDGQTWTAGVGAGTPDLILHVVTPGSDEYANVREDHAALMQSMNGTTAIVRLPDEPAAFLELAQFVRTNRYIAAKTSGSNSASTRGILQSRADENARRSERVNAMLSDLSRRADVFVRGAKLPTASGSVRDVFEAALSALVTNTFTKVGYVRSHFEKAEQVAQVLRGDEQAITLTGEHPNAQAHAEMHHWLNDQQNLHITVTLRALTEKFTRAPYGWTPTDVEGVLAELLVMGKAELKHQQGAVDLRDPTLLQRMQARQGQDAFTIRVPRTVNAEALRIARALANEVLHMPSVPTEAQLLYEKYRAALNAKREETAANLAAAAQGRYPFRSELNAHAELLEGLLAETTASGLFDALREREADFEAMVSDSVRIGGFFRTQRTAFDAARLRYTAIEGDLDAIQDPILRANAERVAGILAAADPTAMIPQLASLIDPIEAHVATLRSEKRSQVLAAWTEAADEVRALASRGGLPDGDIAMLLQPLTDLRSGIDAIDTMTTALAQQQVLSDRRARVDQAIVDRINAVAVSGGVTQRIVVMRPASVAPQSMLTSAADVDAYLMALRQALMNAIDEGAQVHLK